MKSSFFVANYIKKIKCTKSILVNKINCLKLHANTFTF